MSYKRVLVTGSAGFIGSAFVRMLLASDPDVRVLSYDLLTYAGQRENLADLPGDDRHAFVQGDIADAVAVQRSVTEFEPDAVVNFAAETHVDRSIIDPMVFVRTNVMGAQVLLDATRQAGIRMLQISTDEVYGSLLPPETAAVDAPLRPSNPYAASKAAADLLAQAAFQTHGHDVVITRSTNNYGPRQTPEKLFPLMILRAQAGDSLPVYGDGMQIRDWLYVEDHAEGLLRALQDGKPGGIYHFGGAEACPNLDVVRAICDEVGASQDLIAHVEDRPGHDRRYALNGALSQSEFGWEATTQLRDGLRATICWYAENERWCERAGGENLRSFLKTNYTRGSEGHATTN